MKNYTNGHETEIFLMCVTREIANVLRGQQTNAMCNYVFHVYARL